MIVNVKNTKAMIRGENAGKVTVEGKLPVVVCRKSVDSNSVLCQFAGVGQIKDEVVFEVN